MAATFIAALGGCSYDTMNHHLVLATVSFVTGCAVLPLVVLALLDEIPSPGSLWTRLMPAGAASAGQPPTKCCSSLPGAAAHYFRTLKAPAS